jgi:threonine/homoserine/homoserine lactone efflux protein
MDPALLLRGLTIGFAVAFALGPIGLLVIRRTIDRGWRYGFASGAGVATADASYAAVAAFGLTAISATLVGLGRLLGIVGGVVLLLLAARALRASLGPGPGPAARLEPGRFDGLPGAYGSMVALTLTNPATILSFTALFASIGAGMSGPVGAATVVVGVFLGSLAWWAILTGALAGLRARLTTRIVRALNVASALIIGALGAVAIALGLAA